MLDHRSLQPSALSSYQGILIVTHQDPDLDAIGSCLALHFYLESLSIPHTISVLDSLAPSLSFLPDIHCIHNSFPDLTSIDTLIVLDCSDISRVKGYEALDLAQFNTVINIDHHPDNTLFGTVNIMEPLSSVGEMLYHLFRSLNWKISSSAATALYAAIIFDTGRFLFSNVTSETLSAASELVSSGADSYSIPQQLYETKSKDTFDLIQYALKNLIVSEDYGYAHTSLPSSMAQIDYKVIDLIRQLGGPEIFFVAQELDSSKVKINLRSKSDFDVSLFSKQFGGGGHKKASGILMQGSLDKVVSSLCQALEAALPTAH